MANIQYYEGNAQFALPQSTFDITSVTAKRVGPFLNYYSFNTDGTMFVIHAKGVVDAAGVITQQIVGWDHYDGATLLQSGVADLPAKPFLDNLYSRSPNSVRAFNYLMGGDDTLTGSGRADRMSGLNGNDTLNGLNGNDQLRGGNGNDTLDGGTGNDRLWGDAGNDSLTGGLGADQLTGGAGADQFHFTGLAQGVDTLADFASGLDVIALHGPAFTFNGPLADGVNLINGTAAIAAEATLIYDQATGNLSYDADGTGNTAAELIAVLGNHAAVTAADFVLV